MVQGAQVKVHRLGYAFYSDTGTEVAVKLVDCYYRKDGLGPVAALSDKIARVLEDKGHIQWFAAKFANARDIFALWCCPD